MAKQPQRPQQRPTQRPQQPAQQPVKKTAPAPVRRTEKKESIFNESSRAFIFERQNFILFGIGLGLVVLGLALMSGGAMPDPNKWEPERIYSFQRITLAPILMVAGFVVVILGIFKRTPAAPAPTTVDHTPAA